MRVEYNPQSTFELVELLEKDSQNKYILYLVWDCQVLADWQYKKESNNSKGRVLSKNKRKSKNRNNTKKVKKEIKTEVSIY